jgi:biopolymer transport protein ExbD
MKKIGLLLLIVLSLSSVLAQVSKIEISLDKNEFSPNENISYRIFTYDSDNKLIQKKVNIEFSNAYSSVKSLEVNSNEKNIFSLGSDASVGYWKIIASIEGKTTQEIFSVKKIEQASFEIVDNSLIIKNTGNTPYKKNIKIIIGDTILTKESYLDVGEIKKIKLVAPEGTYNIKVSDGEVTISKNNIVLTGNFIGALDEQSSSALNRYPLVWIFLVMLFALFILLTLRKRAEKTKNTKLSKKK